MCFIYFESITAWKMSKYGVISGPYFPVFGLNTEIYGVISVFNLNTRKYGPEITPYLDTFHAVHYSKLIASKLRQWPSSFSRVSLCYIYFDVVIRQRLKKSLSDLNFFFSRANEIKTCDLVQQLILRMLRYLILQ